MKILKKPDWIKKNLFNNAKENHVKSLMNNLNINTVCKEAKCPNIGECFSNKTATFLLLGNKCTRNCQFCNISTINNNLEIDLNEPSRIAQAVKKLELKYVVLTSVTRDDLKDGGSSIFVNTINEIKQINNDIKIEVLVPDFQGNKNSIKKIINSDISVFAHNLETVERLYPKIRINSKYKLSLDVLKTAGLLNKDLILKTGIMVGLGETFEEIKQLMIDFFNIGGDLITIGQYLSPSKNHYPVKEYITPEVFNKYIEIGNKIGIKKVISAPFVRSSYLSEKFFFNKN